VIRSGHSAPRRSGRYVRTRTRVLQARDDGAACLAGHGRGRRRKSHVRRTRWVSAGVLRLRGRCGCLLRTGSSPGGRATGRWPGAVGPGRGPGRAHGRVRGPGCADGRVRGPQTTASPAGLPVASLRRCLMRHAWDRRVGGHVGQARPDPRALRGVAGRLAVPNVRLGATRAGRRTRPVSGVRQRCGAGGAGHARRARRVCQRRGPGGAARVRRGRGMRRRIVVSRLRLICCQAGARRARLMNGPASASLTALSRCRVMSRRRPCHRARLHRDRIADRSRVPRGWRPIVAR
jgi:hypothetical protein